MWHAGMCLRENSLVIFVPQLQIFEKKRESEKIKICSVPQSENLREPNIAQKIKRKIKKSEKKKKKNFTMFFILYYVILYKKNPES